MTLALTQERDAMDAALSRVRDMSGSVQTRLAQASSYPHPHPYPHPTGGCFHVGAVSTQALLGPAARTIVAGRADGQRQDQPLRCQQQLTELAPSSQ